MRRRRGEKRKQETKRGKGGGEEGRGICRSEEDEDDNDDHQGVGEGEGEREDLYPPSKNKDIVFNSRPLALHLRFTPHDASLSRSWVTTTIVHTSYY